MSLYVKHVGHPQNPELVLLHGWGMSSDIWLELAERLTEHFHLTLVDLPGLGRSQNVPEPYTSTAVVELLAEVVPASAAWLGWSMGGQIATAFAQRFPERVQKLVLVASNPCFVARDDWSAAMAENTHQAFEDGLAIAEAKTLTRFLMLQTQGGAEAKPILKKLKMLQAENQHTAALQSLSILREDMRAALAGLSCPVLQLFGEKDNLVPVAAAEACAALTGQSVKIYPEAGHLPFISHQAEFLQDLMAFLSKDVAE